METADCRRTTFHSYRQDAREGGVNPPLPRNCERHCPACVVRREKNQPEPSEALNPETHDPLETQAFWRDSGKAADGGASQETGPWRIQTSLRSEGNEGAIDAFFPSRSRSCRAFRPVDLFTFPNQQSGGGHDSWRGN